MGSEIDIIEEKVEMRIQTLINNAHLISEMPNPAREPHLDEYVLPMQ